MCFVESVQWTRGHVNRRAVIVPRRYRAGFQPEVVPDAVEAGRPVAEIADPAGSVPARVDCQEKVPTVDSVTIQRNNRNEDFRVSWRDVVDGCVDDITIHHLSGHLVVWFDNGDYGEAMLSSLDADTTQITFNMDQYSEFAPVRAKFTIFLAPNDREYGGVSYEIDFTWDWAI